ncbi:hypothetical protein CAEBREN_30086 [Caenorhabditis brenneri]|uniref:Integrase catalytic domain-containing protein n=1 Tax=Caenorhabditis brenneri TaxID=135651 RepID=G0P7A0_CAEBE|nr:hypothetical protein CAEBREN_30086 [Caenorhabditis brenneri]
MDDKVERVVARCSTCQVHGKTPRRVPLEPWQTPERVWERVHVDYAGPENGQYYLVAVDAKSKWAEVSIVKSISGISTVRNLKEMFSQHGYPETIVSDNGTQFISKEFAAMCEEGGIEHIRSPPFHPQSNGQAERGRGGVTEEIMSQFLFHYRSSPSMALGGLSPAEVHFERRLRTRMSLLVPQLNEKKDPKPNIGMKDQFDKHHGTRSRYYHKGDLVYAKVFDRNAWSWEPGTVSQGRGQVVYVITLLDGRERTVHANQLKKREVAVPTKEDEWSNTMWDIFELPKTIRAEVPAKPKIVAMPTVSTTPMTSLRNVPTSAVTQSSTNAQGQSSVQGSTMPTTATAPVQVRRTTRQHKPVIKYDPSVSQIHI